MEQVQSSSESLQSKICIICNEEKSLTEFRISRGSTTKRLNRCNQCRLEQIREQKRKLRTGEITHELYPILPFDWSSNDWQVGKPVGCIVNMEKKQMMRYTYPSLKITKDFGYIRKRTYDQAYQEAKIFQKEFSEKHGLLKNRIRHCETHLELQIGENIVKFDCVRESTREEAVDIIQKYMWHISEGYVGSQGNGKGFRLHVLLSKPESGLFVDHINGDKLDNRLVNLRNVSPAVNTRNHKLNSKNTSGITGVYKRNDKWKSCIIYEGKEYWSPSFPLTEEGKNMAREWRKKKADVFGFIDRI